MKRYYVITISIFLILFCGCLGIIGFYPSTGLASWYDPRRTASGEKYNKGELTCAMRKREFGKYYLVCNLENNKCVEVRHNDFGPAFYFFTRGRIIDLSRDAFDKIANLEKGLIRVRIGAVYPAKMKDERDNFDYGAGIEPKIHAYGG